jgi:outer membrane receptor protein involved in Fe transport
MKSSGPGLLLYGLLPAASAATADAQLTEIVVTGERVARPAQQTASSVSVTTAADLQQMSGVDRVEEVLARTPNVQVGSGSEGVAIRGQDSTGVLRDLPGFLGGARPRVTLQVDGRAVGFNEFLFGVAPLWDVRQVEVYRTPQTTTQGRNAIAGAIFIDTQDPVFQWEGRARLLGGNYGTLQGSFALTGPIVDERVALRVAGDIRRSRPASEMTDVFADADPNRDQYALLRAKAIFAPEAIPGLRLRATYVHSDSEQPQIEGVAIPFEERFDPAPSYGVFSIRTDSLTLEARYPVAATVGTTTTISAGDTHVARHARPGLGQADTRSRDFSLESLLEWRVSSSLRTLGGFHVLRTNLDQQINLSAVLGQGTFDDHQHSLGVFGEAEWRLARKLHLTAGLRFERDGQRRQGAIAGPAILLPIDYNQDFQAWLPRLSLSYELGNDSRIGVLVQRAFNPGGTSLNFNTGEQVNFDAETLWNHELFLRMSFAEGRGSVSANLFHTEFSGAQRAQSRAYAVPGGATAFWAEIVNVPAATSIGMEGSLAWRFGASLQLSAGAGLLDTRIDQTAATTDPLLHKEFARAPHFTGALGLTWRPAQAWSVSVQARHNAGYFSDDANTRARRIGDVTVMDLNARYDRKAWSVFAYARNLLDRFYLTSLFSATQGAVGEPREVGVGVEARF